MLSFPPFRLDEAEEQLWKGPKLLAVRRKPFAILRYLAAHPRRLVTHDEILKEVWGGSVVSESSVRTHLHELRQILGEGLIETVIGRGYRFTGEVAREGNRPAAQAPVQDRLVVGREAELGVLAAALDRVRDGQRQVVFVTGEPGIGKTTLVDAFLESLDPEVFAVRGACVEQLSTPEAYRPVIEMLSQLRHSKHGDAALGLLVRHAPTFLAQVPQLVPDTHFDEVMRRAAGGSDAKVVRELMELFEAVSMHVPHVVVFEDLQWSDVATIDLLSLIGQRRERAKVLVIATSRRAEAQTVSHPLNRVMRALVARSGAIALPLERLDDVGAYVAARFPDHALPPALIGAAENVTGGTPLFLAAIFDDLVAREMIAQRAGRWTLTVPLSDVAAHRPDNVNQLIDIQLDRLTVQEQRVLEAASLVGLVFHTALVAAAIEIPVEQADELCDSLARRALFLRHEGTEDWPDGSQQSCYGFTHGLVRDVCAERSAPARRQRWHRVIGEHLEAAYGERAPEVSNELATHFEHAQAVTRAVYYYILAGQRMVSRFASSDALPSYRRALELLKRMPEGRERDATELRILGGMSSAVLRLRFEGDASIAQFERMIVLADRLGDMESRGAAMSSLSVRLATLGRYDEANAINDQLYALAPLSDGVNAARALPLFWQGRLTETIALLEPLTRPSSTVEANAHMGILEPAARKTVLISYLGAAYWTAGSPDRGLAEIQRAIDIALASGDPYTIGLSAINMARLRYLRGDDPAMVRTLAESVRTRLDSPMWHATAELLLDWVQSTEAPLAREHAEAMIGRLRERTTGFPMGASYIAITAIDALRRSHLFPEARALADEMLAAARANGELLFEPELVRQRGELLDDPAAAAGEYRDAIATARRLGAHSLALRIAVNLARLGDKTQLATALSQMRDGEATLDVVAANQLLSAP